MKTKLLYGLLALLGFAGMNACGRLEYGQPYVEFTVKGNVTDTEENPIEGIDIEVILDKRSAPVYTLTDAQGNYAILDRNINPLPEGVDVIVTATDIDGEENGLFKSATKTVTVKRSDFTGGDKNWYGGEATKTVDFVLEADTPEDDGE